MQQLTDRTDCCCRIYLAAQYFIFSYSAENEVSGIASRSSNCSAQAPWCPAVERQSLQQTCWSGHHADCTSLEHIAYNQPFLHPRRHQQKAYSTVAAAADARRRPGDSAAPAAYVICSDFCRRRADVGLFSGHPWLLAQCSSLRHLSLFSIFVLLVAWCLQRRYNYPVRWTPGMAYAKHFPKPAEEEATQ
jgi:hypothetical protein